MKIHVTAFHNSTSSGVVDAIHIVVRAVLDEPALPSLMLTISSVPL